MFARPFSEDRPAAHADDEHLALLAVAQLLQQCPHRLGLARIAGEIDVGVGSAHLFLQVAVLGAVDLEGERTEQSQGHAALIARLHDALHFVLEALALRPVLGSHANRWFGHVSRSFWPKARFIRGNTDRYLISGEQPGPSLDKILNGPEALTVKMRLASSFAWTIGAVAPAGWLPWLRALPLEMRMILPDGTRVLAVHAAPGTDDGDGLRVRSSDDELREQLSGIEADLVLVGHTHIPFNRLVDGVRLVNPGSVSIPFPPDLRASYAILSCDSQGYSIEHHRTEYDRQAVIEAMKRVAHPSEAYITRFMRAACLPFPAAQRIFSLNAGRQGR